jgi:ribosome biogenesis GTPase
LNNLNHLGWSAFFAGAFEPHAARLTPARVASGARGHFQLLSAEGPLRAQLHPRVHPAPICGDWVGVSLDPTGHWIETVLPRRTQLARKAAGRRSDAQLIAANLDVVFLVSSLNQDFKARRLERYLAAVLGTDISPVLLLSKADLCPDPEAWVARARAAAGATPVHVVSALEGEGLEAVRSYLTTGVTAGFIGSSGVGKSTLINALLGHEAQRTADIRQGDDRGRHATTSRALIPMADGLLMDTPGMRELGLWIADGDGLDGLSRAFSDVADAGKACRFTDCRHQGEPGCGVQAAIDSGELDPARVAHMEKLQREARHHAARHDEALALASRQEQRRRARMYRERTRVKKWERGD